MAQAARRSRLNASLILKRPRDPRFARGSSRSILDTPHFLPVWSVDPARPGAERRSVTDGQIAVDLAGAHRLRVGGSCDLEALARLICGLSG